MHDRVFPIGVPFPGKPKSGTSPRRASDWKCGQPLAFLVEANGKRIYIDSGGRPSLLPPANIAPVDLAILGVALPDSRARFIEAVRRLRPRYILPSHQDNFFQPLDRGFNFGPMTDFPRVLRDYTARAVSRSFGSARLFSTMDATVNTDRSRHALLWIALAPLIPQLFGSVFNIWYNAVEVFALR